MDLMFLLGSAAAAATMVAFWSKAMVHLRAAAIVANILFIAYGALGELWPVLGLHLLLLPLNMHRLTGLTWRGPGTARRGTLVVTVGHLNTPPTRKL